MKGIEVEIIQALIEQKHNELSINQLAKLLKKDYKNVHNIISRLAKASLISLQPFGGSYRIILSNKMHPRIFEAEHNRRKNLLENKDIAVMLDYFKKLSSKLYVLILFGSYAKKTNTKHSDIDLMFIIPDTAEDKMEKEIQNTAKAIPLRLHISVFTESEFKAMKNSKETTAGSEAIKNNIILHGIESYYEMIQ